MGKKVIPKKGRITFSAIEKNCGVKDECIALWKKEYGLSNKLLHVSPQGAFSRIAIRGKMKPILIGPSDEGIVTSAVNSYRSAVSCGLYVFGVGKRRICFSIYDCAKWIKTESV